MTLAPKTPSDTRVTSHALMLPEHANHMGHVHGGWIMKLVDENGGLAATRHSRRTVVTVAVEGMVFHRPVVVGSVLQFDARLVWAGRTSMEVEVKVSHEDPIADTLELVHTARMRGAGCRPSSGAGAAASDDHARGGRTVQGSPGTEGGPNRELTRVRAEW